jgi:hypothetical protein
VNLNNRTLFTPVDSVAVVSTSTTDGAGRQMFTPFNDKQDYEVQINIIVKVVLTPVFTPSNSQQKLADWSSKHDIPIPVRENSVELRKSVPTVICPTIPVAARALVR